jgi:hypothetical protein
MRKKGLKKSKNKNEIFIKKRKKERKKIIKNKKEKF